MIFSSSTLIFYGHHQLLVYRMLFFLFHPQLFLCRPWLLCVQSGTYDRGWVGRACIGKLLEARSRLYQRRNLQPNVSIDFSEFTVLFLAIDKIRTFAPRASSSYFSINFGDSNLGTAPNYIELFSVFSLKICSFYGDV